MDSLEYKSNEFLEDFKRKGIPFYDKMPDGWRVTRGATTAPRGYVWINNGKPRFSKDGCKSKIGLLKTEEQ